MVAVDLTLDSDEERPADAAYGNIPDPIETDEDDEENIPLASRMRGNTSGLQRGAGRGTQRAKTGRKLKVVRGKGTSIKRQKKTSVAPPRPESHAPANTKAGISRFLQGQGSNHHLPTQVPRAQASNPPLPTTSVEPQADEARSELEQIEERLADLESHISSLLEEQGQLVQRKEVLRTIIDNRTMLPQLCNPSGGTGNNSLALSSREFPWSDDIERILHDSFRIPSWRAQQREAINAVLGGHDVFATFPAGGGKSLLYQLPAMYNRNHGLSLIVSPLLSLIHDQVTSLRALGIPCAALSSANSQTENNATLQLLSPENYTHSRGDYERESSAPCLLYVTPEKIAKSKRLIAKLEKLYKRDLLRLFAVDEAHCCSQWGHDFRPDYRALCVLKVQFPRVPLLALTATASQRVQQEVMEMLQMSRFTVQFEKSVDRPNLCYEMREKSEKSAQALLQILEAVREFPESASGIVYCLSRKETEQVAQYLDENGVTASAYHADMDTFDRLAVHDQWLDGSVQVVVATIAFGMGISKPDVRFIIHHTMSKSMDNYYQESGRAGRDGKPSRCIVFFRYADISRQTAMVQKHEVNGLRNVYEMAQFCLPARECLHSFIARHYDQSVPACESMCCRCSSRAQLEEVDITDAAKQLLEVLARETEADEKVTMLKLHDKWRKFRQELYKSMGPTNRKADPLASKQDQGQVLTSCLVQGVLSEYTSYTAYAVTSYLQEGAKARAVLSNRIRIKMWKHSGSPGKSLCPLPVGRSPHGSLDGIARDEADKYGASEKAPSHGWKRKSSAKAKKIPVSTSKRPRTPRDTQTESARHPPSLERPQQTSTALPNNIRTMPIDQFGALSKAESFARPIIHSASRNCHAAETIGKHAIGSECEPSMGADPAPAVEDHVPESEDEQDASLFTLYHARLPTQSSNHPAPTTVHKTK